MTQSRLAFLYERYLAGACSELERAELEKYFDSPLHEKELHELMSSSWKDLNSDQLVPLPHQRASEIHDHILSRKPFRYKWISIAAAIVTITVSILLLFTTDKTIHPMAHTAKKPVEIGPASNKAILTLANGQKIILNPTISGQIASQPGSTIQRDVKGRLLYIPDASSANATLAMNTISIPKGGQYHLILPDQTEVYLNSESVLAFPSQFKGKERRVTLIGEAYFEVAKNAKMPFKVNVNNRQEIEVLGTHFNVKAYQDDETIRTTLAEGSVKISSNHQSILLKPGEMAINHLDNRTLFSKTVKVEEELAWHRGFFIFDNENIVEIMKKLSKWYDVEVEFKGDTKAINLVGNYSRKKSLNSLLKTIELSHKVKFNIEGRRVTVIAK